MGGNRNSLTARRFCTGGQQGKIYFVGADADILSLKENYTKLIGTGGKRLIPGMNDAVYRNRKNKRVKT